MSNNSLKILHISHGLAMIFLLGIGLYYLYKPIPSTNLNWEQGQRLASFYISPSYEYGVISCIIFFLTTLLGITTIKKMPKSGGLLVLGGATFAFWAGIIVYSTSHISINEVFPAWVLWIIIAILLNGIVYLRVHSIPEVFFDNDDILDNPIAK